MMESKSITLPFGDSPRIFLPLRTITKAGERIVCDIIAISVMQTIYVEENEFNIIDYRNFFYTKSDVKNICLRTAPQSGKYVFPV